MSAYMASQADPNTWPAALAYIALFVSAAAVFIVYFLTHREDDDE